MGGGLLQLVAYGAQDAYITGNPHITFWKVLYKRHTNFAMEAMRVNFTGSPAYGQRSVVVVNRNADVPSNKAKTWKFTLRPGVAWEDGKPVTCADVKYGWSRTFATEVYVEGPAYPLTWLDIPADPAGGD